MVFSILQLEKRGDVALELSKLFRDILHRNKFVHYRLMQGPFSFYDFIDQSIEFCPFINGCSSFEEFVREYGIEDKTGLEQGLILIDFLVNYLSWLDTSSWLETQGSTTDVNTLYELIKEEAGILQVIKKQIGYILELANYKIEYIQSPNYKFKTSIIIKRDQDVDSVLKYLDTEPRIRVLTYLDFRIERNVQEKHHIIRALYVDLEAIGSKLSKEERREKSYIEAKLCLNFSRHFRDKNISDSEAISYLDYSFYKFIHYIRENYFKENSHILDAIKRAQKKA